MNTETTTPINEGRCPICGGDNQCGVHGAEPCWCTRVHFSAELLARVPAHLRGRACICPRCAEQGFNASVPTRSETDTTAR